MGDAQAHEVTGTQAGVAGNVQVGVLVVERGDFHRGGILGSAASGVILSAHAERDRKPGVEGNVAAPGAEQRQPGLGTGQHRRPQLQGRPQREVAGRVTDGRRDARVEAVVVGDVAAAAQDDLRLDLRPPGRRQLGDHDVEERAAASRKDRAVTDESCLVQVVGQRAQRTAIGRHPLQGGRVGALTESALVAGHSGHLKRRRARGGRRHREGLAVGTGAGAAAGVTKFDQHRERAPEHVRSQVPVEVRDPVGAVDIAEHLEVWVGVQLPGQPGHPGRVDQFVGKQQSRDAERAVGLQLADRRDRDAPGAGGELPGRQLRRHGGLAVRRQAHPGRLAVRRHRVDVVRQGGLAQGQQRVAQAGLVQRRTRRRERGSAHLMTGRERTEPFLGSGDRPLPQCLDVPREQ